MKRMIFGAITALALSIGLGAQSASAAQNKMVLHSSTGDVTVPAGTTATYDAANGPLTIGGKLVNYGTIAVSSSSATKNDASVQANEVDNDGSISFTTASAELKTPRLKGLTGSINSKEELAVVSPNGVTVTGGDFFASSILFDGGSGKVFVDAETVDAPITVKGSDVSLGSRKGSIKLAHQEVTGDPFYWSADGDIDMSGISPSNGAGITAYALGNISGASLDARVTAGGSAGGKIDIEAGVTLADSDDNPITSGYGVLATCTGPCPYHITGNSSTGGNVSFSGSITTDSNYIEIFAHAGTGSGAAAGSISVGAVSAVDTYNEIENIQINGDGAVTTGALDDHNPATSDELNQGVIVVSNNSTVTVGNITTYPGAGVSLTAYGNLNAGTIDGHSDVVGGYGAAVIITSSNGTVTTDAISSYGYYGTNYAGGPTIYANGAVVTGNIDSSATGEDEFGYSPLQITSNTSTISTGTLNVADVTVALVAWGNVSTGTITTDGGQVSIHANIGADFSTSTPAFVTGSSTSNGSSSINASSTWDDVQNGGIYITNGGTGGITIANSTDLSTADPYQQPGFIILDACNESTDSTCAAPITLPVSGSISVDGATSQQASILILLANQINANGSTLTASNATGIASPLAHYVVIAASDIETGSNGLTVLANGDQPSSGYGIQINNQGANSVSDDFTPVLEDGTTVYLTIGATSAANSPLTIGGTSALTITGNGAYPSVNIQGAPLAINSSSMTLNANGSNSSVYIGSPEGGGGLSFFGAGALWIQADGYTDDSQNNAGGSVNVYGDSVTFGDTTTLTVYATGKGDGDGGNVTFSIFGNTPMILSSQDFISAIAGASGSGLGGTVTVNSATGPVDGSTTDPIDVNNWIKVYAGTAADITGQDGTISLNGVTCGQWQNVITIGADQTIPSWPLTFWDCINPTEPVALENTIGPSAATLPDVITGSPGNLGNTTTNVQIYAMINSTDFNAFFNDSVSDTNADTLYEGGTSNTSIGVSAAFATSADETADYTDYYQGTILHELGHQWDAVEGDPSTDTGLSYVAAVNADVTAFNYPNKSCMVAIQNNLPSGYADVCTLYSGYTNYQIYQILLGIQDPTLTTLPTNYYEAWGRAFAFYGQGSISPKNMEPYVANIEALMTNQQAYMATVYGNGTPY